MTTFASTAAKQSIFFFDMRPYFNCIELPSETLVAAAVKVAYPADPECIIKPLTGRKQGCYQVASTAQPSEKELKFARKKRDGSGMEVVAVPLVDNAEVQGERREGTLVTIVDGDLGDAHCLPGLSLIHI